jgi:hypothetical protein
MKCVAKELGVILLIDILMIILFLEGWGGEERGGRGNLQDRRGVIVDAIGYRDPLLP